ncbi:hypothetical protein PSCICM_46540 [Pseudomonas cichorii]|uniref:Uncharacterized protein n=1 Tax=Pseudomonas cichorii TaxID=36746 RepID=A0ABQ1DTL7_PSECI|nr:hypothetical protein PSCICM_46540 [Pseudomonas cichorii]GFM94370.1 hypothetical protein PSCICP_43420 [Pseudomonas cichorii]
MHADIAGLQFRSRPRQIAGAHEGQENFKFFQGQLVIDLHVVALVVGVGTIVPDPEDDDCCKYLHCALHL